MRRTSASAFVLVAATFLSACAPQAGEQPVSNVVVHDDDGLNGAVLPEPYAVPDTALTATDGSTYSLASDSERPLTLVFFGYTKCPDICHLVMADIASALVRLDDAERAQVDMQFVTTDPARDDESTIRAYLDRFDPSFGGLTGDLADIVALGEELGVPVAAGKKLPSGGYEVDHGTQVLGLLPDGTVPVLWTQGTAPELMAEDIRSILDSGVPDLAPQPGASS